MLVIFAESVCKVVSSIYFDVKCFGAVEEIKTNWIFLDLPKETKKVFLKNVEVLLLMDFSLAATIWRDREIL